MGFSTVPESPSERFRQASTESKIKSKVDGVRASEVSEDTLKAVALFAIGGQPWQEHSCVGEHMRVQSKNELE